MERSLFTQLTITEQESLSGGRDYKKDYDKYDCKDGYKDDKKDWNGYKDDKKDWNGYKNGKKDWDCYCYYG